ncbi:MAG: CpaD family pilus assembly protein [Hyphomicrobium sp.]
MKSKSELAISTATRSGTLTTTMLCLSVVALGLGGCKHGEEHAQVAGWTLVDPTERHPILVSQQPQTMTIRVVRGSGGLSAPQRGELVGFANRSRASDAGNTKLVIAVPSGASNEVAAMNAVHEIRQILSDTGIPETAIAIEAYSQAGDPQPPIRVSYLRYIAEGPHCGQWTTNLAHEPQNLPHPNLGCATQKNLAAMVANPADLLGPRSETSRSGERRDTVWEKYTQGDVTNAKKGEDERVSTQGGS